MTYRDQFEECPDCRIALDEDTGSTETGSWKKCSKCGGLWSDLQVSSLQRSALPLADAPSSTRCCPRCREPMESRQWYGSIVEFCPHQHGFWLDSMREMAAMTKYMLGGS